MTSFTHPSKVGRSGASAPSGYSAEPEPCSTVSAADAVSIPNAVIHTARKSGSCANAAAAKRGVEWAQHCSLTINPGDQYVDGDLNLDKAGGFGRDRVCMSCAERGLA